jgi:hypothetical protein
MKTLYAFLLSPLHATCPDRLILLYYITLITSFIDMYKLWSYTLSSSIMLLPPSVTQSLCQHPVLEHPQIAFLV